MTVLMNNVTINRPANTPIWNWTLSEISKKPLLIKVDTTEFSADRQAIARITQTFSIGNDLHFSDSNFLRKNVSEVYSPINVSGTSSLRLTFAPWVNSAQLYIEELPQPSASIQAESYGEVINTPVEITSIVTGDALITDLNSQALADLGEIALGLTTLSYYLPIYTPSHGGLIATTFFLVGNSVGTQYHESREDSIITCNFSVLANIPGVSLGSLSLRIASTIPGCIVNPLFAPPNTSHFGDTANGYVSAISLIF